MDPKIVGSNPTTHLPRKASKTLIRFRCFSFLFCFLSHRASRSVRAHDIFREAVAEPDEFRSVIFLRIAVYGRIIACGQTEKAEAPPLMHQEYEIIRFQVQRCVILLQQFRTSLIQQRHPVKAVLGAGPKCAVAGIPHEVQIRFRQLKRLKLRRKCLHVRRIGRAVFLPACLQIQICKIVDK